MPLQFIHLRLDRHSTQEGLMKTIAALCLCNLLTLTLLALPVDAQRYGGAKRHAGQTHGGAGTTGGGGLRFNPSNAYPSNASGYRAPARTYGSSTGGPYASHPDVNPYIHNGDQPAWRSLNMQLDY